MRYAFTNQDNVVVQIIVGKLTRDQQDQFLRDYRVLFGASNVIEVPEDVMVSTGFVYTDGAFDAPPVPELLPESLPEPQLEPEI